MQPNKPEEALLKKGKKDSINQIGKLSCGIGNIPGASIVMGMRIAIIDAIMANLVINFSE